MEVAIPQVIPYTMEGFQAMTSLCVLDALGIGQGYYIGLSIGGMLGQAFALSHTAKLCPPYGAIRCPAARRVRRKFGASAWLVVREAGSLAKRSSSPQWNGGSSTPSDRAIPAAGNRSRTTIISTTAAGYLGCSQAILTYDFVPRLPSLKLPVLVVCSDGDAGTPPAENKTPRRAGSGRTV